MSLLFVLLFSLFFALVRVSVCVCYCTPCAWGLSVYPPPSYTLPLWWGLIFPCYMPLYGGLISCPILWPYIPPFFWVLILGCYPDLCFLSLYFCPVFPEKRGLNINLEFGHWFFKIPFSKTDPDLGCPTSIFSLKKPPYFFRLFFPFLFLGLYPPLDFSALSLRSSMSIYQSRYLPSFSSHIFAIFSKSSSLSMVSL